MPQSSTPLETEAKTVVVDDSRVLQLYGFPSTVTVAVFNQGQWLSVIDKAITQAS